jgi:ribosomal-protein-alanine N-acetyltransferase
MLAFLSIMPPYIDVNLDNQASATKANNANQYRIRSMVQTDIPNVFTIDQATWNDEAWPLESFFDSLNNPLYNCWILESTTTDYPVLGYGFQVFSNGISHITNLCIHPNRRGRGLGEILLLHMIDYGYQLGTSIVELEVHISNTPAFRLYVKHGFRIIQFLERYYSDTAHAYRMQLIMNKIV